MGKTLVTGATGRLGANVVRALLERGDEVRALVMPNDPLARKLDGMNVEVFEGDLTQADRLREAVRGVQIVMHFAAIMDRIPDGMSHETYFDVNTRSSYVLMDEAHVQGVEKFIYTSSTAVYDVTSMIESPLREETELRPHSQYGVTKVAAEGALMSMAFLYDLPLVVLRPSYIMACDQVLGLGQPGCATAGLEAAKETWCGFHVEGRDEEIDILLGEIRRKAEANPDLNFIPYGPEGPWHWHVTDVRDVVDLILLALDDETVRRGIFNCAGPRPTSFEEAVKHKCERTGLQWEEVRTPVDWQLIVDISKARKALGYEPRYDVIRMIDDAVAFSEGEDIGVIPA